MDHLLHHYSHGNTKAERIAHLLREFQQRMPRSTTFPQQITKPLNLPFKFSFAGQMQFRMAVIATLLQAALKQMRIVEERKRDLCKQMEAQTHFERMLEALIVLFCKQSNNRENIVMILLAYTTSKDGAKMLVSHQLDKILVSMMHSETDNTIKETSIDILCSLVSLNDSRCLRVFRSSPEAAAEFIRTLKREGSVKIKCMADYLAGKFFEQLEYDTPKMNKFHSKS